MVKMVKLLFFVILSSFLSLAPQAAYHSVSNDRLEYWNPALSPSFSSGLKDPVGLYRYRARCEVVRYSLIAEDDVESYYDEVVSPYSWEQAEKTACQEIMDQCRRDIAMLLEKRDFLDGGEIQECFQEITSIVREMH